MGWFGLARTLMVGLLLLWQCGNGQAAAPANDNFANRIILSDVTNLITASNVGASSELGEPQHAGGIGGRSVWWSWTAHTSGTVTISTAGSSFDTLLGIYLGVSVNQLTEIASSDDVGDDSFSVVFFRAITGETYQIAVDGFQGATGSITLRLAPSGDVPHNWLFSDTNENPVSALDFPYKVVILDFFETTCGDCIFETPDLVKMRDKHAADGFEIIGVAKDNLTVSEIVSNAAKMGITYPLVLNDPTMEAVFGQGGPLPMPTKILLDRERKMQIKIIGGQTASNYDRLVTPLLHGAANLPVAIKGEADHAVLSWPATEFGYLAESSTNLIGGPWTTISLPVVVTNGENTVALPTTEEKMLYRLRKPQP